MSATATAWRTRVEPSDATTSCAALKQEAAELAGEIAELQDELRHAATNQKAYLIRQIAALQAQLKAVTQQQKTQNCDGVSKSIAVSIPVQEQSNWCWAAVGSGISNFYDHTNRAQCDVVTTVFKRIHPPFDVLCCSPAAHPELLPCNGESGADQALDNPAHHFVGPNQGPLAWNALVQQIDLGQPVAAEIEWNGGGSHFVAITGYALPGGAMAANSVYVQDPAPGQGAAWITYDGFLNSYLNSGRWTLSSLSAIKPQE